VTSFGRQGIYIILEVGL